MGGGGIVSVTADLRRSNGEGFWRIRFLRAPFESLSRNFETGDSSAADRIVAPDFINREADLRDDLALLEQLGVLKQ